MKLMERVKATALLRLFGLFKIPTILFAAPRVVEMTEQRCAIMIRLGYRTRNHLGGMYFGMLATGADCAGGLAAMDKIKASGQDVSLIFKDFHADFLKRAEGDVLFTCDDGEEIARQVAVAVAGTERVTFPVRIVATCPSIDAEPVANFTLTLSLKKREKKK